MPLILSEQDLKPLYNDPASMDALQARIEQAQLAYHGGNIPSQHHLQMPLLAPDRQLRILAATLSEAGEVVRVNPQYRGVRDRHMNFLFDGQGGDLLAVIAGGELNVWRTAAPAGLACRYLAQPSAKILALLGSSRQARGQLVSILRKVPSLEKVRVFSPNEEHRKTFAARMGARLGIEVEAVNSARAAIDGAKIISLATNSRVPVLEPEWLAPGALTISITSGQLSADLVARSRVIATWKGELLEGVPPREPYTTMMATGTWSEEKLAAEFAEVILGQKPARNHPTDTIVFESLGMPAFDATAAAWAYRWALDRKIGKEFALF